MHDLRKHSTNYYHPIQMPLTANYCTSMPDMAVYTNKPELKLIGGDLLQKFHNLENPLQKNLGDTVPDMSPKQKEVEPKPAERSRLGNILSGLYSSISCVLSNFQYRRADVLSWHTANAQNNAPGFQCIGDASGAHTAMTARSVDCRVAAAHCENKLDKLRQTLAKPIAITKKRRPKRAFYEAGSVEEVFEDAVQPETLGYSPGDPSIEYITTGSLTPSELVELAPETLKIEECKTVTTCDKDSTIDNTELDQQVITSCEDKVNKLKAMLEKKKEQSSSKLVPIQKKTKENLGSLDSIKSSYSDDFDEIEGRFHRQSDSDDSFQIVFTDRSRRQSDCVSEDSFIVFESQDCITEVCNESPESCYSSADIFEEDSSDESCCSDSGCSNLAGLAGFSRTVSDLTDDSLYETVISNDELDCAPRVFEEEVLEQETRTGVLVNPARKEEKRQEPAKTVRFSPAPPKVHVLRVWAFAARQARAGHWERHSLDRERFKRRIADVDMAISWVLKPQHRSRVKFQRFMPWWNAQRRQEAAEKKERMERERMERELASKKDEIDEENDSIEKNDSVENNEKSLLSLLLANDVNLVTDDKSNDSVDVTKSNDSKTELSNREPSCNAKSNDSVDVSKTKLSAKMTGSRESLCDAKSNDSVGVTTNDSKVRLGDSDSKNDCSAKNLINVSKNSSAVSPLSKVKSSLNDSKSDSKTKLSLNDSKANSSLDITKVNMSKSNHSIKDLKTHSLLNDSKINSSINPNVPKINSPQNHSKINSVDNSQTNSSLVDSKIVTVNDSNSKLVENDFKTNLCIDKTTDINSNVDRSKSKVLNIFINLGT